jgi:PhoPQ-activated pathogenicity-related protein
LGLLLMAADALNFHTNIHHFWRAFGGWTFALADYYELNFTRRIDDPNLPAVRSRVPPTQGTVQTDFFLFSCCVLLSRVCCRISET